MAASLLLLLAALNAAQEPEPPVAPTRRDGGTSFATEDDRYTLDLRFRAMLDRGWFGNDALADALGMGRFEDGSELRRLRLLARGHFFGGFDYKSQWDFSDHTTEWLELYLDTPETRLGRVRAGQFREPMGLEANTGSASLTFLERSSPTGAFTPGRNRGAMWYGPWSSGYWFVGAFREAESVDDGVGDESSFTGRVTWTPLDADDGRRLLHLGVAANHRDTDGGTVRFADRPEAHLLDPLVDSGDIPADEVDVVSVELAWVNGPWSLQTELFGASTSGGTSADFVSGYAQASWFLTGQHRTYRRSRGGMGPPDLDGYPARYAWEVALRLSRFDVHQAPGVVADRQDSLTVGLNWYLTREVRVMWNWIHTDIDGIDEDADFVVMRLQIGF